MLATSFNGATGTRGLRHPLTGQNFRFRPCILHEKTFQVSSGCIAVFSVPCRRQLNSYTRKNEHTVRIGSINWSYKRKTIVTHLPSLGNALGWHLSQKERCGLSVKNKWRVLATSPGSGNEDGKADQRWRTFWSLLDASAWIGTVGTAIGFLLTQEVLLVGGPLLLPLVALYASRRITQMDALTASTRSRKEVLRALRQFVALSEESAADMADELEALVEAIEVERKDPEEIWKKMEDKMENLEEKMSSLSDNTVEAVKEASEFRSSAIKGELLKSLGALRRDISDEFRQTSGDEMAVLNRLDSRLAALEGAVSGLELAQSESIRRIGSNLSAAFSDGEDALISAVRAEVWRSLEPIRTLPLALAKVAGGSYPKEERRITALPIGSLSQSPINQVENTIYQDRTKALMDEERLRDVLLDAMESRPDIKEQEWYKDLMQEISSSSEMSSVQWNKLVKRLLEINTDILESRNEILEALGDREDVWNSSMKLGDELNEMRQNISDLNRTLENLTRTPDQDSQQIGKIQDSEIAVKNVLKVLENSMVDLRQEIRADIAMAQADLSSPASQSWISQLDKKLESFLDRAILIISEAESSINGNDAVSGLMPEEQMLSGKDDGSTNDKFPEESQTRFVDNLKAIEYQMNELVSKIDVLMGNFDAIKNFETGLDVSADKVKSISAPKKDLKLRDENSVSESFKNDYDYDEDINSEVVDSGMQNTDDQVRDLNLKTDDGSGIPISTWLSGEPDEEQEDLNGNPIYSSEDGQSKSEVEFVESISDQNYIMPTQGYDSSGRSLPSNQQGKNSTNDTVSFISELSFPDVNADAEKEGNASEALKYSELQNSTESGQYTEFETGVVRDKLVYETVVEEVDEEDAGFRTIAPDDEKSSVSEDVSAAQIPESSSYNELDLETKYVKALDFLKQGRQVLDEDYDLADEYLENSILLFEDIAEVDATNVRAMGNLGNALMARGRLKANLAWKVRSQANIGQNSKAMLKEDTEGLATDLENNDGLSLLSDAEDLLILAGRWYSRALQIDPLQSKAFLNWGRAICFRAEIAQDMEETESSQALFMNAAVKFGAALDIELRGEEQCEGFIEVMLRKEFSSDRPSLLQDRESEVYVEEFLNDPNSNIELVRLLLSLKGSALLSAACSAAGNERKNGSAGSEALQLAEEAERILTAVSEFSSVINAGIEPGLVQKLRVCEDLISSM